MSIQKLNSLIRNHVKETAKTIALSYFDFDADDSLVIRAVAYSKLFELCDTNEQSGILAKTAYTLLNSHAMLAIHLSIEAKEQFDRRISSLV